MLVEMVIPEQDRDFSGKWSDLEMLVFPLHGARP